jgi:acyl-homoserine lactone acylase PvdQ
MAPDGQNFRSINAMRMLASARNMTLDSLIAKGYDHYLAAFEVLLPTLLEAWSQAPDSVRTHLAEPVQLLRAWDLRASEASVATTLATEWGSRMLRKAPPPRTIEESSNGVGMIDAAARNSTPSERLAFLSDVLRELSVKFGTWKVPWGDLNRYQRLTGKIVETYSDSAASLPVGFASSSFGSLPSFQSRFMPGTKLRYGISGNSFIAAVEFGPHLVAKTIVTGGESSDPTSPHFTDQAEGYIKGHFKDVYFYKEDVLAHAEKTYHPGD